MNDFKKFYIEKYQIDEGIGDVLGDIVDKVKGKIKDKISNVIPKGVKDFSKRLFNVENDIIKLTNEKKYKELGKLLVDKDIPQEFKFKRIKLFNQTYRDIPLFFGIVSLIFNNGDYQTLFADIEAGGNIDITTFLNQKYGQNNLDLLSFILRIPNIQYKNQSLVDKSITPLLKALPKFGYNLVGNNNMALITAARLNSLPLFKAFIDNGVEVTPEVKQIVDRISTDKDRTILDFINKKDNKGVSTPDKSKTTTTSASKKASKNIDLKAKHGYDKDNYKQQSFTLDKAKALLEDLTILSGKPISKAQIDTLPSNTIGPYIKHYAEQLKYPGIKIMVKK